MQHGYDVVIVGGAFSGASTGILLKRARPSLKVLIVEKSPQFDRKVGESTTEISACFLTQVLAESRYLGHEQLAKQGLRMWFSNSPDQDFGDLAELGPRYQARLPGFQLDRAKMDEHLLEVACAEGCELLRPATVSQIEFGGAAGSTLLVKTKEIEQQIRTRWIVDASGRASVIGRKLQLRKSLDAHPIDSIWARFKGVGDLDGPAIRARYPEFAAASRAGRGWATNHLLGYGWWVWVIPLKGGDTSIGVVWDRRLHKMPEGASPLDRLLAHLKNHPFSREFFSRMSVVEGDVRTYTQLPYLCERVGDDGWLMVGDAAGFIDPLYSPGLDFCSYTSMAAHRIILESLDGKCGKMLADDYNAKYQSFYHTWFNALYRDKYYLLGDAELMASSLLLDIASYFLGPVRLAYDNTLEELATLPFNNRGAQIFGRFMSFYRARLVRLARMRRERGIYGSRNRCYRELYPGFMPDFSSSRLFMRGLRFWLKAEITSRFRAPMRNDVTANESDSIRTNTAVG
jgi:flavin-dependent dehydrogenase